MRIFDINRLTKIPNLIANDGLTCYPHHCVQQNPAAFQVFYEFLQIVKPKRILEIGTGLGGFTNFLRIISDECELNVDITTVDIYKTCAYDILTGSNINVIINNLFYDNYMSVSSQLIDYVQQEGISIVLCDGGYKIGEFKLLSQYIKPGDFIMAHDYSKDREYFIENIDRKVWNWLEIQDSDIQDSVEKNKLLPFMEMEFQNAVWVCKIKSE